MLSIPEKLVCAQLECVMPTWCHVGVLCRAHGGLCHTVRARLECVSSTCCPDSVQQNNLLVMHVVRGVPQWLKEPILMEDLTWIAAGMLQFAPRARRQRTTNP